LEYFQGRSVAPANRRSRAVFALIVTVVLAALALAGVMVAHSHRATRAIAAAVRQLPPPIPPPQEFFGKSFIRVLVVGLDYDYNALDEETSAHSRSDIIMALGIDLVHRRISVVSVPRDMVATLPVGRRAKINQAQADGGIVESQRVVADWLGIPEFDRYVVLRIDTTKNLIDALGGIDIDVKNADALRGTGKNGPLNYDDSWGHLHVHLQPGPQHLDGTQGVGYARFRHDWCSDPCRIMRQQQVIHAIVQRAQTQRLGLVLKIAPLLDILHRDIETNLSTGEEVSLAYAFRGLSPASVPVTQIPYSGETTLPEYGDALIPDDAARTRIVQQQLGGTTVFPTVTPLPQQRPI
jgi:LCP family protein required for cell wall assembly